ncbi:MAG: hypothetical protein ACYC66_14695 [Chloroflexota bacterium]
MPGLRESWWSELATMHGESPEDTPGSNRTPRLRYCPLEPGEPVGWEECSHCPHCPEPPLAMCSAKRRTSAPRRRGFWDQEPVGMG